MVSGPSGVGKDLVLRELLGAPDALPQLRRVVTVTTRPPRSGERDGEDYRFLSRQEFERLSRKGGLLESVEYAGEHYGTPVSGIELFRDEGHDVILKIEVRGAMAVRDRMPGSVLIFVAPPSEDELILRLSARGTDDDALRNERLRIARDELRAASQYDYIIVNDYVGRAVDTLRSIILAHRARVQVVSQGRS